MPGTYSWLTFASAKAQLSARLSDPNQIFWSNAEIGIYIQQALRQFNVLTATWKTDFAFTSTNLWNSLGSLANSPRLRTLTDTYCYTDMENRLLEPASGGTWTGTTQFSISDLSGALQRRRDEMLMVSACNDVLVSGIALTPNTVRTFLPDNTIDVVRVRYITANSGSGWGQGGWGQGGWGGSPGVAGTTLYRDDTIAQEFYEVPLYQQAPGTPQTFSLSSEPPLSFDVDIPPSQPGTYEAVVLQSGTSFAPPGSTPLGIPDDFAWVAEMGALADLLGRESEATDRERADFCMKRYQDGLKLLIGTPWIMLAKVNGAAVNVDSIADTDRYMPEWDSNPVSFGPVVVTGGIDFFAAPLGSGIGVTCLGNAPVPQLDADFVQVARSDWDTVLDLAQSICLFKMGGMEWKSGLELEARAIQACSAESTRLQSLGAFSDILLQRGQAMDRKQERYSTAGAR